eukprot:SAG25_NODE_5630_length_636_cov_1.325885_2_plen_51_part_00
MSGGHGGLSSAATIRRHTRRLLVDREFAKLLVGFGLGLGVFNALLTMVTD